MKLFLILTFVFIGFVAEANAQLCGQYTTTLIIKSDDNKSVENAVVQLLALEKNETKNKTFVRDENDKSKFSVTFNEGHLIPGKYKIIVSADGFETAEREIGFPHCKHQTFEIKLKTSKAQNQSVLTGTVYDPSGALVLKTKVTAKNEKGVTIETETDEEGVYVLNLPCLYQGIEKYEITVEKYGFEKFVLKDFKFVYSTKGRMYLDIALGIKSNELICPKGEICL